MKKPLFNCKVKISFARHTHISMNKKRPTSDFRVSQLVMKVEHLEYTHMALVKKKDPSNVKKKNMLIALYRKQALFLL